MPNDMSAAIIPKSDQWNYDDFLSGPITFKIRDVTVKGGQEQPVQMSLEGTDKFYRPCKSMARVFVAVWGPDSKKYIGRSITLYGDPKVRWGGVEVGGIRISHMTDIDSAVTMALTMTRANKKPFTVRPLVQATKPAAKAQSAAVEGGEQPEQPSDGAPDPLLVKAGEWAECGTEKYAAFWKGLTAEERKQIGTEHHETFKQIAATVPV